MQYRYIKGLYNKIKKLNLNYEDTGGLLVCLYLKGCSEKDCAKLFEFTLDSIINYLKYEEIYEYKICSECEKLKERNNIEFKNFRSNRKDTYICTKCEKLKKSQYYLNHKKERKQYQEKNKERIKKYSKLYHLNHKKERKQYREKNKERISKCQKLYNLNNPEKQKEYYLKNKDKRKEYNKLYQEKNKEKLQKYRKEYNKKNRKNRKEYNKLYQEKNKEKLQKYRKEYHNSLVSKEILQQLRLYEEVKGNQIKCRYCGDWYIPTIMEVHNRLQGILNNDTGYIYCSEECKEACPTFNKQLYPKGFKQATSREVNPVFRQLVFERD